MLNYHYLFNFKQIAYDRKERFSADYHSKWTVKDWFIKMEKKYCLYKTCLPADVR